MALGGAWLVGLGALACVLAAVPCHAVERAQPPAEGGTEESPGAEPEVRGPRLDFGIEAKANFRKSDDNRFPVRFPFTPDMLPVGQMRGFEETVNAGSHLEVSSFTLFVDASWGEGVAAHAKLDAIDLYERNPTSSAKKVDVDEVWLLLGRSPLPGEPAERSGAYVKVGKFPKFERQNDRHLESYGLASTAFNRIEDVGLEVGVSLGRHLYLKGSATQGNPVFLRDPNALAGDNGIPSLQRPNPDPELKTGIVIPYDAETQEIDVDGDLQIGAGIGVRCASEDGRRAADLLVFGRRRDLSRTVEIDGTFYGGDLDLLDGPASPFDVRFPVTSDRKQEVGGNLWLYWGGLSLFAQYVDQDLGGLPRTGGEAEVAWRFELPLFAGLAGRQLFPSVAPAVRYSKLDPDFRAPSQSPSPSFAWEWEKWDLGVRLTLLDGVDLTAEYAANRFILGSGAEAENDELLTTLRWRM